MNMESDVPERQFAPAGAYADGALPDGVETGTVLDYLWEGQQGSVFEPVEAAADASIAAPDVIGASDDAGEKPQDSNSSHLDSTLNRYNSWLVSLQSSMGEEGQEHLE